MELEIYCVKDERSGIFLKPFDTRGVTDAIRSVKEVANDPKSFLNKYSEDYSLYLIGKMDDQKGIIHRECQMDPPTWTAPLKILDVKTLIEKGAQ